MTLQAPLTSSGPLTQALNCAEPHPHPILPPVRPPILLPTPSLQHLMTQRCSVTLHRNTNPTSACRRSCAEKLAAPPSHLTMTPLKRLCWGLDQLLPFVKTRARV